MVFSVNFVVFLTAGLEIFFFLSLTMPMPKGWKQKYLGLLSHSKTIQKFFQYHQYMLFVVAVLFLDSVRQSYNYIEELRIDHKIGEGHHSEFDTLLHGKKFQAQRNVYLHGITLFISYAINRYVDVLCSFYEIKDTVTLMEKSQIEHDSQNKNKTPTLAENHAEVPPKEKKNQ